MIISFYYMCGISVIIDSGNKHIAEHAIRRMNNIIDHRGPDGENYYFGDHFALGHRMLKITDLTDRGKQPMLYMHYVIIYNGEIYNYRTIKETLKKCGYQFKTTSDTEVIGAAYDKWGYDCLHHFNGMWAFVLYDTKNKMFFCSRDRFGIKPLFYSQLNNKLLIGSEIKQITVFPDYKPRINQRTAFDFIYHGKIDSTNESFFDGVHFLPAGHNLIYDLRAHSFSIIKWYDLDKIKVSKYTDFNEATNTFGQLFTESISDHTDAKLPIGACLSGGLDSTSIVGVSKKMNKPLVTFSSCYTQHGYNEIEYINNAVRHYELPNHKTYPNIHELIETGLLKKIVYHQDQPVLSGSFFSEFKVFEAAAANDVRIMLSGQGADEYLGGYGEFSLLNLKRLLQKRKFSDFTATMVNLAKKQNKTIKEVFISFVIFGLRLPYFINRINQPNQVVHECFNTAWLKEFVHTRPVFDISAYSSLSDLSKYALNGYSLPHQLLSEDRNSMSHSIESRLPFLDHRLVEYSLGLPDNNIIRKGVTKAVLRESLKNTLPAKIYNRHTKLGFPGPEESLFTHHYEFIHKELRDYTHQFANIFSSKLPELHTACHNNKIPYNNFLFRALSFGTWAREFKLIEPVTKPIKASFAR